MSTPQPLPPNLLTREMLQKMILQFRDVLLAREYLPPREIRAYQNTLLTKLVEHAMIRVPFYRERLAPLLQHAEISLEKWSEIPLLTRPDVQCDAEKLHAQALPHYFGTIGERATSGSTGRPIDSREDDLHIVASEAQMDRAFGWWKVDGSKTHATFMSTYDERFRAGDQIRYGWRYGFPGGARHILELMVDIDKQIDWLKAIRPAYLSVRGGAHLAQLAWHAQRRGEQLRFERILSGGCGMTSEARQLAEGVFKSKVADIYGTSEAGLVAYECPDCGFRHTCDETILVEVLRDDGTACTEGETGRVVLTPLYNYAMSLIRYEIGDYAARGPERAPCGRGLSSLSAIVGRYRNVFLLRDGRVIQPYVHSSFKEYLSYRQIQFVQTDYEHLEIRYVPDSDRAPNIVAIEELIHRLLDPSVAVTLVPMKRFETNLSGKFEETLSLVRRDTGV